MIANVRWVRETDVPGVVNVMLDFGASGCFIFGVEDTTVIDVFRHAAERRRTIAFDMQLKNPVIIEAA